MKKDLILKKTTDIDNLFLNGISMSGGIIYTKVLDSDSTKFLFAVSSKKFKRAVDRNRIKRLMREVSRKLKINNIKIAFIYTGTTLPTYAEIEYSINKIVSKL